MKNKVDVVFKITLGIVCLTALAIDQHILPDWLALALATTATSIGIPVMFIAAHCYGRTSA